jgi:hypothetical protein
MKARSQKLNRIQHERGLSALQAMQTSLHFHARHA